MIWIMLLMILYLCLRVFRYRIASSAAALRLSWYAYYVPLMLVPALFLYGGGTLSGILLSERDVKNRRKT